MFPVHERPKENDRILSFENVLTPYGASVALAGAAVGATLRLCSPAKGITSKCRAFPPDIIFWSVFFFALVCSMHARFLTTFG